jgi:superfamily I DNA and/or RNA helicase
MVFVGDLYQLPPVVGKEERDIFRNHYATPYFFSAKALETTPSNARGAGSACSGRTVV